MDSRLAYPVPFRLDRDPDRNKYTLTNMGAERVDGVTFTLHGAGIMRVTSPTSLDVGASLHVVLAGSDLARSTILVVRWFRPDAIEYLWRVAF